MCLCVLSVRHNEEQLNAQVAAHVPWRVDRHTLDDPHTKTYLLLQAFFANVALPIADYINDTKSVLDQVLRVINAMVDVAADAGHLTSTLRVMELAQAVSQARFPDACTVEQLPGLTGAGLEALRTRFGSPMTTRPASQSDRKGDSMGTTVTTEVAIRDLLSSPDRQVYGVLESVSSMKGRRAHTFMEALRGLPQVTVQWQLEKDMGDDDDAAEGRAARGVEDLRYPRDKDGRWIVPVDADVKLALVFRITNRGYNRKAPASRFPKKRDFGWWVVVGDPAEEELVALKRVPIGPRRSTNSVYIMTPEQAGPCDLELHLKCDAFAGLDQTLTIPLRVVSSDGQHGSASQAVHASAPPIDSMKAALASTQSAGVTGRLSLAQQAAMAASRAAGSPVPTGGGLIPQALDKTGEVGAKDWGDEDSADDGFWEQDSTDDEHSE